MNTQPEALRLATILQTSGWQPTQQEFLEAAAELRRLHKENRELRRVLYDVEPYDGCVAIVNEGMGGIEWLDKPLPDDTPLYTAPPKPEWAGLTDEQRAVLNFMLGADELDGVWFGDRHPKEKDSFWWRNRLRNAFQDADIEAKLKEKNT